MKKTLAENLFACPRTLQEIEKRAQSNENIQYAQMVKKDINICDSIIADMQVMSDDEIAQATK